MLDQGVFSYFRNWPFILSRKAFFGLWLVAVNAILEPGDDPRCASQSTNLERLSGYAGYRGLS